MHTVIFACVHNAGRSQMAAALFNEHADPALARALSAGTQPAERVHPEVLQVMGELGIDLSSAKPQKLSSELARGASLLVTLGCRESCPAMPGVQVLDWPLDDPKGLSPASVRTIRDQIRGLVEQLLAQRDWRRPG